MICHIIVFFGAIYPEFHGFFLLCLSSKMHVVVVAREESLKTILYICFFLLHSLSECYLNCRFGSDYGDSEVKIFKDMMTIGSVRILPSPPLFFLCILTQLLSPAEVFYFLFYFFNSSHLRFYNIMHVVSLFFVLNFLCLFLIYLGQTKWFVLFSCFLQLTVFVVWCFVFFHCLNFFKKLASFSVAVEELTCRKEFANYLH